MRSCLFASVQVSPGGGSGPTDDLDRLVALTRGTQGFSYDYDDADNLTERTYPDGTVVAHDFDDGRLAGVTQGTQVTSYAYDAVGNRTAETRTPEVTSVNRVEAREITEDLLNEYARKPYEALVTMIDAPDTGERFGRSGTQYQYEVQAFWDGAPGGNIRIMVSADDRGWRSFFPLTGSFIMDPEGLIVGAG